MDPINSAISMFIDPSNIDPGRELGSCSSEGLSHCQQWPLLRHRENNTKEGIVLLRAVD